MDENDGKGDGDGEGDGVEGDGVEDESAGDAADGDDDDGNDGEGFDGDDDVGFADDINDDDGDDRIRLLSSSSPPSPPPPPLSSPSPPSLPSRITCTQTCPLQSRALPDASSRTSIHVDAQRTRRGDEVDDVVDEDASLCARVMSDVDVCARRGARNYSLWCRGAWCVLRCIVLWYVVSGYVVWQGVSNKRFSFVLCLCVVSRGVAV